MRYSGDWTGGSSHGAVLEMMAGLPGVREEVVLVEPSGIGQQSSDHRVQHLPTLRCYLSCCPHHDHSSPPSPHCCSSCRCRSRILSSSRCSCAVW